MTLLLIDFQRGMVDHDGPAGSGGLAAQVESTGALRNGQAALQAARENSIGVIHVRLAFDPNYSNRTNRTTRFDDHERARRFLLGSRESEYRPEVAPIAGEVQLAKGSVSPFASTDLFDQLRRLGTTSITIAGVATHLAVESAAREGADRGLAITVLSDACASPTAELHAASIERTIPAFATIITTQAYLDRIAAEKEGER